MGKTARTKSKKPKKTPFELDLRAVATDLQAGRALVYSMTRLTGGDARRRSVVRRVMATLNLGEYDIDLDKWTLDRDRALAHLVRQYNVLQPHEVLAHLADNVRLREQVLAYFATPAMAEETVAV